MVIFWFERHIPAKWSRRWCKNCSLWTHTAGPFGCRRRFCGISIASTEFQIVIDKVLFDLKSWLCFTDNVLIERRALGERTENLVINIHANCVKDDQNALMSTRAITDRKHPSFNCYRNRVRMKFYDERMEWFPMELWHEYYQYNDYASHKYFIDGSKTSDKNWLPTKLTCYFII